MAHIEKSCTSVFVQTSNDKLNSVVDSSLADELFLLKYNNNVNNRKVYRLILENPFMTTKRTINNLK